MGAILHEPGGAVFLAELTRAGPVLLVLFALAALFVAVSTTE